MVYANLWQTAAITGVTFVSFLTNQTAVFARPLFSESAQYIAQQELQSSAVMMVQLPQVEVNLESDINSEIMGQLAVPLQLNGQTIPAGSYVRLAVVPNDGNANLVADMIIIPSNGATISIVAAGSIMPGETVTDKRGSEVGRENTAIGSYLGERVGLALGGDADDALQTGSIGGVIGAVTGLASPSQRQVVRLTQGVYVLNLD